MGQLAVVAIQWSLVFGLWAFALRIRHAGFDFLFAEWTDRRELPNRERNWSMANLALLRFLFYSNLFFRPTKGWNLSEGSLNSRLPALRILKKTIYLQHPYLYLTPFENDFKGTLNGLIYGYLMSTLTGGATPPPLSLTTAFKSYYIFKFIVAAFVCQAHEIK